MNAKYRFVLKVLMIVLELARIIGDMQALIKTYTDRGYQPGGADPLTDADFQAMTPYTTDVDPSALTLAKFNEIANTLIQFQNFMTGQTATKADHSAVVNKYRTDL